MDDPSLWRFWNDKAVVLTERVAKLEAALKPMLQGIEQSQWHDVKGERMKRVLVAETAIERMRDALARESHPTPKT